MSKINKKWLVRLTKQFNAQNVSYIPPMLWHKMGFDGNNEDKINFLIHIINKMS